MVLNSLSFCLSVRLLLSPSNLNEILAGWGILGCRFFLFFTLNLSCHSLLACRFSTDKSAVILMGVPLYVICHLSLVARGWMVGGMGNYSLLGIEFQFYQIQGLLEMDGGDGSIAL